MANDPILNSVKLIVTVGSFAANPGLLSGLGAGASVAETVRKMALATPLHLMGLAGELTANAQRTFDATPDLPEGADVLFGQMVEFGLPDAQEIVAANLQADAVCNSMLAKLDQVEHTRPQMQRLFRNITVPVLERVLSDKGFVADLTPVWMASVSVDLDGVKTSMTDHEAKEQERHKEVLEAIQRLSEQSGTQMRAFEGGISEAEFIALAKRISDSVDDISAAYVELERTVAIQINARHRRARTNNSGEFVDTVMARVDALNDEGRIDEAATAIWDEIERQDAAQTRLIDKGIAQAILTRDVDQVVRLELKKLALDGGGFDALRGVRSQWYERGRDKGLRFDLEVAIALAQKSVSGAIGPDQRGGALHNLGTTLQTLGERESGTDRLHDAVAAYTEALTVWTQRQAPLDWATTQNNLGNALVALGMRENRTDRLREAVAAYAEALKEQTREQVPPDWARTQNNLGIALQALGTRVSGTNRLHEAIAAFTEALKVRTRDRVPLDWAMTQGNLCNVELALFDKTGDSLHLDRAQGNLTAARDVFAKAQASQYLRMAERQQAEIDERRAAG